MLLVTGCGDDPTGPGGEDLNRTLIVSAQRRSYILHVPNSYSPDRPAPLLVLLHGANDNAAGFQMRIGLDPAAERAGFLTAYPEGLGASWTIDDIPFIQALIADVADTLAIDSSRLYLSGMSRGAMLVHTAACELAGELAAVASVAATLTFGIAETCQPARPLPILFVHGTDDQAFPWNGAAGLLSLPASVLWWARHNDCSLDPRVEWLPDREDDGTRVWVETYASCTDGAAVKLYGIEGGGHTWPGAPGPFSASLGTITREISSEEIVAFLSQFSRAPDSSPAP